MQATITNNSAGKLAAIEIPSSLDNRLRAKTKLAIDESFVAGFRNVVLICATLALTSGLVAALTISQKKARAPVREEKQISGE